MLLPKLSIVNIVATAELGQPVDLAKLAHESGFLYDKAVYNCAYLKDRHTHGKVSVFTTGKMICVGAKRFEDARNDLKYAAKKLAKLKLVPSTRISVKLKNIVATADLGFSLDIERLSRALPDIIYEPEQFPGAIYYAKELEGASVLIFASGKVVFAGLRRMEQLETAGRVAADLVRHV